MKIDISTASGRALANKIKAAGGWRKWQRKKNYTKKNPKVDRSESSLTPGRNRGRKEARAKVKKGIWSKKDYKRWRRKNRYRPRSESKPSVTPKIKNTTTTKPSVTRTRRNSNPSTTGTKMRRYKPDSIQSIRNQGGHSAQRTQGVRRHRRSRQRQQLRRD